MNKKEYRYKRYRLPLPKALGETLDVKVEYVVKLFGPGIVYLPEGLENSFSCLEKLEKTRRENRPDAQAQLTDSMGEDSRIIKEDD
jgi:hypothetical protein